MSDESAAYTVTIKHGAGFDAPWTVIRGDSPEELIQRVRAFRQHGIGALVAETAREAGALYVASGEFEVTPATGGEPQRRQAAPPSQPRPAQSQPPAQGGAWPPGRQPRYCKHGEMIFKSGTKQNGKPWAGAFCPRPKSDPDQCAVQWL